MEGLRTDITRTITRPKADLAEFGQQLAIARVDGDKHLDIVEAAAGSTFDVDFAGIPGHVTVAKGGPSGPTASAAACRTPSG